MSSGKEKEKYNHCLTGNLFHHRHKTESPEETLESIAGGGSFTLERIISSGQTTSPQQPYSQKLDEWVVLLQGKATVKTRDSEYHLCPGDYLFIPAGITHWITYTSKEPECIWLALHAEMNMK